MYKVIKTKERATYSYSCYNYLDALITMWLEIIKEKEKEWLHIVERKHNYRKLKGETNDYIIEIEIRKYED